MCGLFCWKITEAQSKVELRYLDGRCVSCFGTSRGKQIASCNPLETERGIGDHVGKRRERAHGHLLHRGSRRLLAGNPPGRSRGVASRTLLATSRHPASPFPTILMTTGGIRARRVPPALLKRVGIFGNARVNRVGNGCTKRGNRAGNAWQLRWIRRCSALDARHQNVRPGRYHGSTVNCSGAAIGETGNGHGSAPLQTVRNATGGKHPTRPPVA